MAGSAGSGWRLIAVASGELWPSAYSREIIFGGAAMSFLDLEIKDKVICGRI